MFLKMMPLMVYLLLESYQVIQQELFMQRKTKMVYFLRLDLLNLLKSNIKYVNFPAHFKIIISTNLLKLPNRYQQPIISHWKHPHKRGSQPVFKQQTSNSPKTIIMDKTKELINVADSQFLFKASLEL